MDKRKALSIAKKFVKSLPVEYRVKKAFLFGSFARGNAHADSDIDVAVVLPGTFDDFDMTVDLMRIGRKIDSGIEPHPIEEKEFKEGSALVSEILKYGIQLR